MMLSQEMVLDNMSVPKPEAGLVGDDMGRGIKKRCVVFNSENSDIHNCSIGDAGCKPRTSRFVSHGGTV